YNPTQGKILLDGKDLNLYSAKSLRMQCGIVMQDNFVFSDTIRQNVILGEPYEEKRFKEAISMACLDEFIEKQPLHEFTKIGRDGMGISGGEKQRIMIARAIYKRPNYLMLDEATSSLDAENEQHITDNIASLFKNHTMVVIAHRLSTVKNADNIIVLRQGRIVEQGDHRSLVSLHGYYYDLVKNQIELADA
ncbi:MAG: ATP-binding cassette domain-containing protein, partial [Bacteroidaceae bacterium]|nr:ATP-binding cassette domain-containing protein [Bacteroidaceae bacterium]